MKSALTCIIPALCLALLCVFAPHADAASYTWDGNGNDNNGGNWSDPNNWAGGGGSGYPDGADDDADLRASLSSDRYITNDVATTVGTVTMEDHTRHHLVLGANMTMDTLTGAHDVWLSHIHFNGYTLTLSQQTGNYMAKLDGPGTFVKVGTGQVLLQGEDEYTGTMIVSNGTLNFRSSLWDTTTLMTVEDGATADLVSTGAEFPTNILINGNGYNSGGALQFSTTDTTPCSSDITLGSDSKMKVEGSTVTATLSGDILGSDVLTLEGPGTFILAGTGVTYTNKLIITNGTTQVAGNLPNLKHILVDKDGILEGLQSQFVNATVTTQNGGVWNVPNSAEWTGGGDGSNWTDVANWAPPVVPTNVATIPYPASSRTIYLDAATTLAQLALAEGANNKLELQADLTVDLVDHPSDDGYPGAKIRLNGNTLTVRSGSVTYFPALNDDVGGSLVKNGTETVRVITEDNFTGSMIVNNGVLYFYGGVWDVSSGLTVNNGGQAYVSETGPELPPDVTINGPGYGNAGAVEFGGGTDDCGSDITVATDSKMKRLAGGTTTLTGDILGNGVLTLEGPGAWILGGTSITYTNKLIITNGTTQISGDFPDLKHVRVDAGGVLEALPTQIPSATVVETNGGVWNVPDSAAWTGNGDANNGGNWSDTANWSPSVVPTNQADLQATLSTARYITNDVAWTVDTIVMEDHANNHLVLGADLTVNTIDGDHDKYKGTIHMNGYTLTVGQDIGTGNYFPGLDGSGLFVKVSTGTVTFQGADTYTGSIIVSNGTLRFRSSLWDTTTLMTVIDGATAELIESSSSFPTNIVINGTGYSSAGALKFSVTETCASDITLGSDSKIVAASTAAATLTGNITGPGDLTFTAGAGGFDLDGVYNFAINGAAGNKIIADSGDVDISGATLTVTGEGSGTAPEYVVIDFSGSGTRTGTFAVENLPDGWTIDYDGTDLNPDCVVVSLPPPGLQLIFK